MFITNTGQTCFYYQLMHVDHSQIHDNKFCEEDEIPEVPTIVMS